MRRLIFAAAASAAFFVAMPMAGPAFAGSAVTPTYTVPECLVAAAGQNLMADTTSPDDCLLGTTGGPF